ncbi:hypothetical protein RM844_15550 [Streptomyces sp. DSM 44915]|uniref:DUF2812 domain-containing protein n=1 Tax=Streptomyces chisholmiae TaxID=3075540 RepID=A0ABU2JRT8_9ACTN|nr:hypothetical protein [Streptomyces sp. DSM 44915]MDT0267701.1 hypothetical protein [Streptomyces sp. DSM 44915]
MRDEEIIRAFDGRDQVSVTVTFRPERVVAIAHEFGYTLTDYSVPLRPTRFTARFTRDDSEPARHRATWAAHHHRTTGTWWAACWPTPPPPHGISPDDAARHRIAVHLERHTPWRHPLRGLLALTALTAIGTSALSRVAPPLAVLFLTLAVGGTVWGVLWAREKSRAALPDHLARLAHFEAQRAPRPTTDPTP